MRSKTLLVSNIFATVWTGIMLYFVVAFFENGGAEYFVWANRTNYFLNDLLGSLEEVTMFTTMLNAFFVLMSIHTGLFTLATIFGWIGYICKGAGFALSAAILYLVGTLLCPIFILSGLPIIILGFVGQACQRKLNKAIKTAEVIE